MTIYLDTDYRCHLNDDGTMTPVETDRFEGKCAAFIEGYRYIPDGEVWTHSDGQKIHGMMVAPAEPYRGLELAQRQHEEDDAAHLIELAALIEEIYMEDLEVIDNV